MCLVKPLIDSNLLNLLHFSSDGPASVVDKELLSEDYGGTQRSIKQLHEEQRTLMETKYRDWLIETEMFKVDEKKRIKKPSKGMFASFTSSFKSLDIDWYAHQVYFTHKGPDNHRNIIFDVFWGYSQKAIAFNLYK